MHQGLIDNNHREPGRPGKSMIIQGGIKTSGGKINITSRERRLSPAWPGPALSVGQFVFWKHQLPQCLTSTVHTGATVGPQWVSQHWNIFTTNIIREITEDRATPRTSLFFNFIFHWEMSCWLNPEFSEPTIALRRQKRERGLHTPQCRDSSGPLGRLIDGGRGRGGWCGG